jgi:D-aminopeptidase
MSALLLAVVVIAGAFQSGGVETIVKDSMSNMDEARQAVARTEAEWAALWRSHNFDKPAPKVDFNTRTVVAVFLGSRPTAGYDLEIVATRQEGGGVVVEWAEVRPEKGLILAQVLTSPALIASIPKAAGEVTFRKITR